MNAALRRSSGFTLVELVLCVALVGLLASVAAPLAELTVKRHNEAELRRSLREIREGIDAFKRAGDEGRIEKKADQSGYPETLGQLVEGVRDQRHPDGPKLYFLRRLPRDPFAADGRIPADRTWGLRSYASSGDNPQAGNDVYDVHSRDDRTGLNGVPYAQW
jgi:general secretion pathway protein G